MEPQPLVRVLEEKFPAPFRQWDSKGQRNKSGQEGNEGQADNVPMEESK